MTTRDTGLIIFEEDEVSRTTDEGKEYGLILETNEFVSSDEEDDEEEENDRVKKGTVRVAWHPNGEQIIVEEKILHLEDRSLMPGDVVRRLIAGENSQRGFVLDLRVLCDVRVISTGEVLRAVDSADLTNTEMWDGESQLLTLDSWVGRVEFAIQDVIVKFADGARLKLCNADVQDDGFIDFYDQKREEDSEFTTKVFYEGQVLEETYKNLIDRVPESEWLHQTKLHGKSHSAKWGTKKVKVTVEQVITQEVDVHWMCPGFSDTNINPGKICMPHKTLKGDALNRIHKLDYFDRCSCQIGDRAYLRLPTAATLAHADDTSNSTTTNVTADCNELVQNEDPGGIDQNGEDNGVDDCEDSDSGPETEKTKSNTGLRKRHVISRHGSHSAKPRSARANLHRIPHKRRTHNTHSRHVGMVAVEVIHTMSLVDVRWQDATVEKGIPSFELYPIHHLDELEFFPGDYVTSASSSDNLSDIYGVVTRVDHRARICMVKWITPYQIGRSNKPSETIPEERSVYDIKDHPDYKFRPDQVIVRICGYENTPGCSESAGQIVDVDPGGQLLVNWADGTKSFAYPQEVFLISDEQSEYGSSDMGGSDADDSMCSWETEDEETDSDVDSESDRKDAEDENNSNGPVISENGDEVIPLGPEDKIELDNLLDRVETSLDRMQPDVIHRIVDCYKNVLSVYKRCQDLDRVLGCTFFDDKELSSIVSQVRKELRREKQNKMQTNLLQQAKSFVAARRAWESLDEAKMDVDSQEPVEGRNSDAFDTQNNDSAHNNGEKEEEERSLAPASESTKHTAKSSAEKSSNDVEKAEAVFSSETTIIVTKKSKSEPANLCNAAEEVKGESVKANDGGDANSVPGDDLEEELCANLEKARSICAQALKCLRQQIVKVREQLDSIWQKKVEQMKKNQPEVDDEDMTSPETPVPGTPNFADGGAVSSRPQLMSPLTPDQSKMLPVFEERFTMLSEAPSYHRFYAKEHTPQDRKSFLSAVRKEIKLLRNNLPAGIKVVGYEERMDLYTVLIVGPSSTPYEDGLFFFDVQLGNSYPSVPPSFHYISFCTDRLNPNLYEDGKVCVSLLGTWGGKGTELWGSGSNMLQVLVSVQGLILNAEPYYNEAGYDKQRSTQMGQENSQVYNEMAILKLVQSMMRMLRSSPIVFKEDMEKHMRENAPRMISRLESWIEASMTSSTSTSQTANNESPGESEASLSQRSSTLLPDFPLIPASKGFCLTLKSQLKLFTEALKKEELL